ncbi:MAG TPA: hypothetical protein VFC99_06160 [Acidimicrobiia bacterium]|nr:hypothetical protein [Acidimicrobiia bacterium]
MNDEELVDELERSVTRRLERVSPRPDPEVLLTRVRQRAARQRARVIVVAAALVVAAGVGGYLVGDAGGHDATPTTVAAPPSDGTPPATAPDATLVEPVDPVAARAAVTQAFEDAFDGSTLPAARDAATQDGAALHQLRDDVLAYARRFGYTPAQLAGTTITVLDVSFIDETHASVRFTITVPGRGEVMVDKVGYAVFDGGRWKVALRTACDLISLDGIVGRCPPS